MTPKQESKEDQQKIQKLIYDITQEINKDTISDKPTQILPLIKINNSGNLIYKNWKNFKRTSNGLQGPINP